MRVFRSEYTLLYSVLPIFQLSAEQTRDTERSTANTVQCNAQYSTVLYFIYSTPLYSTARDCRLGVDPAVQCASRMPIGGFAQPPAFAVHTVYEAVAVLQFSQCSLLITDQLRIIQ